MIRKNRAEREAMEAAAEVFRGAGWSFHEDVGGKHKLLVVALPNGGEFRFPVCNTPKGGVHGAVKLAVWNARKLLRKHGAIAA